MFKHRPNFRFNALLPVFLTFFSFAIQNVLPAQVTCVTSQTPPALPTVATLCDDYGNSPDAIDLISTSASSLSTTELIGEDIFIAGVFTIDVPDFKFTNCNIEMAKESEIVVLTGMKLTAQGCRIFACDKMWKGIRVNSDGQIIVDACHIEDAQYAIRLSGVGSSITNNLLNRNHIGIFIEGKGCTCAVTIFGNVFDCTMPLNDPYEGQTPTPATNSFAGIYAKGVDGMGIGWVTSNPNEFYHQYIGILSEKSFLAIRACLFEDMINAGDYEGYRTGIGISGLNNSAIYQRGFGSESTSQLSFSNCPYTGIYSNNSVLRCEDNAMADLGIYGIYIENVSDNYSSVRDNYLTDANAGLTENGIVMGRSLSGDDDMQFNHIDFDVLTIGAAITGFSAAGTSIIQDNVLDMDNGYIGLDVHHNGDNVSVITNTFNFTNGGDAALCYYLTGEHNGFFSNDFNTSGSNTSIKVYGSQNVLYCDNDFAGSSEGMDYHFTCMGTVMKENRFGDHNSGLLLSGNPEIGDQKHYGNRWSGTYSNYAAEHTGNNFLFSSFFVNTDNMNGGDLEFYPTSNGNPSVNPASNWFIVEAEDLDACYVDPLQPPTEEDTVLTSLDLAIADNSYDSIVSNDLRIWNARRYLYRKLNRNPSISSPGGETDSFKLVQATTTVGKFYEFNQKIRQAHSSPEKSIDSLYISLGTVDSLLQEYLVAQDSLIGDPNNITFQTDIENLLTKLKVEKELSLRLRDSIQIKRTVLLQDALNYNNAISTAYTFEKYEQRINEIWVDRLMNPDSALTTAQYDTLIAIGSLCPDTAGPAVFRAINLLPFCERKDFIANYACATLRKDEPPVLFEQEEQITIFPNPVSDQLRIEGLEAGQSYTMLIYDIMGRLIQKQETETNQGLTFFNTSEFLPGTYIVGILKDGKPVFSEKFIVLH